MKYLLDTNTCIIYIKGKNLSLKQRMEDTLISDIAVCSVVKSELFYGSMKSANPERNYALQQEFLEQFISLPFDDTSAHIFGTIRAQLEKKGTPIGFPCPHAQLMIDTISNKVGTEVKIIDYTH